MCKYRVRYFNSKRAFLVLVWTLLVTIVISNTFTDLGVYADICNIAKDNKIIIICIVAQFVLLGMLGAVLSGWLADAKWGNYRVMKYSIILLFITSIGSSIITLLPCSVHNVYIAVVTVCLGGSILLIATVAFFVTAFQLGLDQMPDASSSSITSFIAWFGFCFYAGVWTSFVVKYLKNVCFDIKIWHIQLVSFVLPLCTTVVLVSHFVLAQKWLLIEPKSPQTFKTIYQVLKFAWKHKSPLNRSALTYWEEDIPPRMDLGKSRYGGPFTTEQVEDVKTILRLITLCSILGLLEVILAVFLSNNTHQYYILLKDTACKNRLLQLFTYNPWWCGMVWTVFYEFLIYPVIRNKLPSILKRIGIIFFLVITASLAILILRVLFQYYSDTKTFIRAATILNSTSKGLFSLLLLNNMLEFICAQAPYNMRGKFGGWIAFLAIISYIIRDIVPHSLITYGIGTGLSLLGFVVYCLLARWYKRRVRDEEYCTQRVVEEVYDRYLTAREFA